MTMTKTKSLTGKFNPKQLNLLQVAAKQTLLCAIEAVVVIISHSLIALILLRIKHFEIANYWWNIVYTLYRMATIICIWLSFSFSKSNYSIICANCHRYCMRRYQLAAIRRIKKARKKPKYGSKRKYKKKVKKKAKNIDQNQFKGDVEIGRTIKPPSPHVHQQLKV